MKNKIQLFKQRLEQNKDALCTRYNDIGELIEDILNAINLLLAVDAPDEKIKLYLQNVNSSITILEERLKIIENLK